VTPRDALLGRGFVAAGDGVVVRADARERARALGLASLEEAFALPAVRRAQGGGRWKALAVVGHGEGAGQGAVYVKRWDFDRLEVALRGALKWNFPVFCGLREAANLLDLAAAGLRVASPLAAGEATAGRRRRSFVALEALSGAALGDPPSAPASARRAVVLAVADVVGRLHAAGFWHKDLYAENVRLDPALGPGLLDCERVERRAGGPPRRWRVKDLAALDGSVAWASATDRLRFLRRYAAVAGLPADLAPLARDARTKARRMAARGARW
jgi:hypothetical protein